MTEITKNSLHAATFSSPMFQIVHPLNLRRHPAFSTRFHPAQRLVGLMSKANLSKRRSRYQTAFSSFSSRALTLPQSTLHHCSSCWLSPRSI
jgi:hypothetical protein